MEETNGIGRSKRTRAIDLAEQKVYQEANHRIKNNLQLILSLLNLQANEYSNESVKNFFGKGKSRLNSIFLIHENFDLVNGVNYVNILTYINDLIGFLLECYNIDKDSVEFNIDADFEKINSELAVPLGLILNELISNSLLHAFVKNKKANKVEIQLVKLNLDSYKLVYRDNGLGSSLFKTGLGFKIIELLINQIDGSCLKTNDNGLKYDIIFPII